MTKEEEILAIAEEEFLDKGYDAASTAVIAKRAGVTHAMVNYYYRSKEKLFVTVMGMRMHELMEKVKAFMKPDDRMTDVIIRAALTIFDSFNECRKLPFLLLDVARTHPEFLAQHREVADKVFAGSIREHAVRLSEQISSGDVPECTMGGIYDSVLTLASSPFLIIPVLENVMGMTEAQVESYLADHRTEMVNLLNARYNVRQ